MTNENKTKIDVTELNLWYGSNHALHNISVFGAFFILLNELNVCNLERIRVR